MIMGIIVEILFRFDSSILPWNWSYFGRKVSTRIVAYFAFFHQVCSVPWWTRMLVSPIDTFIKYDILLIVSN